MGSVCWLNTNQYRIDIRQDYRFGQIKKKKAVDDIQYERKWELKKFINLYYRYYWVAVDVDGHIYQHDIN